MDSGGAVAVLWELLWFSALHADLRVSDKVDDWHAWLVCEPVQVVTDIAWLICEPVQLATGVARLLHEPMHIQTSLLSSSYRPLTVNRSS